MYVRLGKFCCSSCGDYALIPASELESNWAMCKKLLQSSRPSCPCGNIAFVAHSRQFNTLYTLTGFQNARYDTYVQHTFNSLSLVHHPHPLKVTDPQNKTYEPLQCPNGTGHQARKCPSNSPVIASHNITEKKKLYFISTAGPKIPTSFPGWPSDVRKTIHSLIYG